MNRTPKQMEQWDKFIRYMNIKDIIVNNNKLIFLDKLDNKTYIQKYEYKNNKGYRFVPHTEPMEYIV